MIKEILVISQESSPSLKIDRGLRIARAVLHLPRHVPRCVFAEPGFETSMQVLEVAEDFQADEIITSDSSPRIWLSPDADGVPSFVNNTQAAAYYIALTAWGQRKAGIPEVNDEQHIVVSPPEVVNQFLRRIPSGGDESVLNIDVARPLAEYKIEVIEP